MQTRSVVYTRVRVFFIFLIKKTPPHLPGFRVPSCPLYDFKYFQSKAVSKKNHTESFETGLLFKTESGSDRILAAFLTLIANKKARILIFELFAFKIKIFI